MPAARLAVLLLFSLKGDAVTKVYHQLITQCSTNRIANQASQNSCQACCKIAECLTPPALSQASAFEHCDVLKCPTATLVFMLRVAACHSSCGLLWEVCQMLMLLLHAQLAVASFCVHGNQQLLSEEHQLMVADFGGINTPAENWSSAKRQWNCIIALWRGSRSPQAVLWCSAHVDCWRP